MKKRFNFRLTTECRLLMRCGVKACLLRIEIAFIALSYSNRINQV